MNNERFFSLNNSEKMGFRKTTKKEVWLPLQKGEKRFGREVVLKG